MLKINFEAETANDTINPMSVANALIANAHISIGDIEEIEGHLREYTSRRRREEIRKRRTTYTD